MKKLLVMASTFPRWKDDTLPPFVYELSKRLTKDFDVSVLAPHYPGAKTYEVMEGMKIYRFRYFFERFEKLAGFGGILPTIKKNKFYLLEVPFFLLGEFLALKKLTKKIQPDIIHAHWIIPQGFIAVLNKKITGVDYIVTSHGSDLMGIKGFKRLKKFILNNAKSITVVSNCLKEEIVKNIDKKLENKINVIPMGVDINLFNPNKKDLSIKRKYDIKGPFLLFVGRLAPEKGIDTLIEAMPEVIKKLPKTKLMIIGDGTLKEKLLKRVKDLSLKKNIIFMGWINNKELPKYYATADIFVCPSMREGFGLTFVEAGMCGCNLIGSNIGGILDIIKYKQNLLIKEKNTEEITKKIIKLIRIPFNKNKIINNLKIQFNWDIIIKKYLDIIK